jgi:hypothetical protein
MLSPEALEEYRRMTAGQRLELSFRLTEEATPYLFSGSREQIKRKFELLRRQNDERNRRILAGVARTKKAKMRNVTETLHTLVELLDQLSVDYAVMGGFAVRAHGVPRPTYDIDVTIVLERARISELFSRLQRHDYSIPQARENGWIVRLKGLPLIKLQRYIGEESLDVDLFLAESEFQLEVMKRRLHLEADGHTLSVVSPEDLVLFKLLAARPRDLGDVADVLFIQGQLDETYMRRWARELGVSDRLEKALAEQLDD